MAPKQEGGWQDANPAHSTEPPLSRQCGRSARGDNYSTGADMSKPPFLRVVGKDAEPDTGNDEALDAAGAACIKIMDTVKAGGGYWLLLDDTQNPEATFCGDLLEMSAMAEEVARHMKMAALGMA